jgi:eukaryotic-like serine/threonine-protein kinase
MQPTKSVEEICAAIERYQLMSSKDFAGMRARWFRPERKDAADPAQFRRWLVSNRYLTDFVARVLSGRKSDQLVLNQYRLQDQLISGPMAGAYLALDALDRPVAVEVLSSDSAADKAVLAGFQQAALRAMDVQHPNVGRVVDCGEAHGLHYLVREYYEGQTLEEVLERRGKLPYQQAARLIALALAGLEALHAKGVPAGDLTADCLLLTPVAKGAPHQRTVKILHAGVRRRLFDETAIGRSISMVQGIPDELELASSCTFQVGEPGAVNPPEDIFRLGCVFYRCVTGKAPYAEQQLPHPSQPATPVGKLAPEVPEMLCQIIEQMIDPVAANRPQKAAHVAKSLRVFLAAEEEQAREAKAEEHIVAPTARAAEAQEEAPAAAEEVEEDDAEEEEAPRPRGGQKVPAGQEGLWAQAVALWQEARPEIRDLVFLAAGALLMLVLIFLVEFLTGLHLSYVAGLATGAVASYFVDRFVRWRQGRRAEAS